MANNTHLDIAILGRRVDGICPYCKDGKSRNRTYQPRCKTRLHAHEGPKDLKPVKKTSARHHETCHTINMRNDAILKQTIGGSYSAHVSPNTLYSLPNLELMYTAAKVLVDLAYGVKEVVLGIFGARSPQYGMVSGDEFTRIKDYKNL